MNILGRTLLPAVLLLSPLATQAQTSPFPLNQKGIVISRPTQLMQPFTVAGERGVLVGTQDGQFESWILPVKLISHLTIEANIEGYSVPIAVNQQSSNIEVRPVHTTITYAHIGFTIRQIMFSPDDGNLKPGTTQVGPIVLFQIDSVHPIDLVFRFTPEMRWMWPKRNDGIPSPEWIPAKPQSSTTVAEPGQAGGEGYYVLHMDYPDLAGAITIPTATPGIAAPYQERPQVHPMELHLHYDPKRDGTGTNAKYFPLLMATGTTHESASNEALGEALTKLNQAIPDAYKTHASRYEKLLADSTSIQTPDKSLNEAFQWGVASIEQLKAQVPTFEDKGKLNSPATPNTNSTPEAAPETAFVAGYYASGDSARPGFGWFFGRDSLYTLYAVNSFGDFALTRAELEFLIARQRADGKIMHEFAQTAADPSVDWKQFSYMYAAADATPLFLMATRDYLRASGDTAFLQAHKEAIEKAWAFETAPTSDTDHDGIYDNSQGTGWVESWPQGQPHQEVYLALLDEQASQAYAAIEQALGKDPAPAQARAAKIHTTIESEYYDPAKNCYAFSHNTDGSQDKASSIYPAIAYWDDAKAAELAHPAACLEQWASPTIATDWGLRDVATTEPFYDGMSYHQGSVWPLFTGWGALAEYRANQPLPAQQMLMQNVDLTWAQDPGAVTELLSGDYFVPFGRSTSHQLWSSAMVITPTLRGLFGIELDAATNTITLNPHLPADWDHAEVNNIHLDTKSVDLIFTRTRGVWSIGVTGDTSINLRSDIPGAKMSKASVKILPLFDIPVPPVELSIPEFQLPVPGSRPAQAKILSTLYGPRSLTATIAAPAGSDLHLGLRRNTAVDPKLTLNAAPAGAKASLTGEITVDGPPGKTKTPKSVNIHFPLGEGWQTLVIRLTW